MAMSNTEQNSLFQAIKSLDQVVILKTQGGVNVYQLCKLTPIRSMTPAEAEAYAALYSVTIASP